MAKKRKHTKKYRHQNKTPLLLLLLRHIHTQNRRIPGVITLRDNCKLYTSGNAEQLEKYLKEKGLI